MGELSDTEGYRKVGKIVGQYELYQCYECTLAVMQCLRDNKTEGKMIELRTCYRDENYIISDRIGTDQSITLNDFSLSLSPHPPLTPSPHQSSPKL